MLTKTFSTKGFSLVELLTCLAVLGVFLGLALPGFRQFSQSQQLVTAANTLHGALLQARSEAIKRRLAVLVVNTDGNWHNGWRTYADVNDNGTVDPDEPLITIATALPDGIVARGNTPVRYYVRYSATGRSQLPGGAFQAGTIAICHSAAAQRLRRLVISASGRPRLATDGTGTCSE